MKDSKMDFRFLAEHIFDTVRESLIILDENLHVLSANRSFYEKFRVCPDETERCLIFDLGNGQWNIPELKHLLKDIIPQQSTFKVKVHHRFETIGDKVMLLNGRRIERETNEPALILLAIEDITETDAAYKKLEKSEAKYRKFVEGLNSIIIGFDTEGEITFFNHFAEKLFGYNRTEVIGKYFVGTIIPCVESSGKSNAHISTEIIKNPGNYYVNENEGIRKDGSRIFFSWSARVTYDEMGKATEIIIDGNDITEILSARKKIETDLSVLETILEFIPVGLMITDRNHIIQKASKSLENILDVPVGKLLNTDEESRLKLLNLNFPDGSKIKPDELPLSKSVNTGEQFLNYEMVLKIDGRSKTLFTNSSAIRDKSGNVIGAIGIWQDITEQISREREHIRQRKLFEQIIREFPVGIALHEGPEFITTIVNKAYYTFAYGKGEIRGKRVADVWPEVSGTIIPLLERVVATGEPFNANDMELTVVRDKGPEKAWFSFSYLPFYGEKDKPTGVLVWSIETTRYMLAQKEIEHSRNQLAKQQQFYESILSNAGVAIAVLQGSRLIFFYVNPTYQAIRPDLPMVGKAYRDVFPEAAQAGAEEKMLQVIITGEPWVINRYAAPVPGKPEAVWEGQIIRFEQSGNIEPYLLSVVWEISESEKSIFEAQQRYTALFNTKINGIAHSRIITDKNGKPVDYMTIEINDTYTKFTGIEKKDIEGKTIREVFAGIENDPVDYIGNYGRVAIEGGEWQAEAYFKHLQKWFSIYAYSPAHTEFISMFTDITSRKKAETELINNKNLLQTIIESIPVMITLYDPQIKRVEFNKAFEQISGWTEQDTRSIPLIELVYPDPSYRKMVSEYMQSLTPGFRDLVMVGKNGDRIDSSWANIRIPDGRQVGIGLDLRERLQNEKALKRSEAKWNLAIESIDAGVIIATEDEQVIYWNPASREMFGIKSTKENFEPLDSFYSTYELWTTDREKLLEPDQWPMRRIKRNEKVSKYELRIRRPDQGWEKIFSYSGTMVEITNGERLIFLTIQDLTELRKTEQQLRNSNQELESFSYSVAHDLRNPLKIIKGFIDILIEDCSDRLDDECRDYVNRISNGTDRMNSIISDILALSKISRQEITTSTVDLSEMAILTIEELRRSQPDYNPEVIIQKGLSAEADARLMSVTLGNLLGNAWKYSSKTQDPRIEFGAIEKGGKIIFFIKDNGAGFDMNKSADLFTPFKRLHSDNEFKGIGVGLAIVDRAIKRHGGRIWAESEPEKGATFYFTLK